MEKAAILQDLETYLRNEGQRMNTINGNVNNVGRFIDWLDQEQLNHLAVSYTDLLAYVNYNQEKGNSKSTINSNLVAIKHFYNHLQQEELVAHNPAEEIRIRNVVKRQPHDLLDWEELEQLYQDYPTSSITGKRNKTILGMLIYQGLNSGEVAKIELTDVQLEAAKVYVPSVARSNSRTLKLAPTQILQLQKYITQVRPIILALKGDNYQSEKLFLSTGEGGRLDNSLNRLMKATRKLNPKIKDPKQIRASVITYWLKKHNIRQVQYMTGHRYISSTERYRTDTLESLQEQIEELHPLK